MLWHLVSAKDLLAVPAASLDEALEGRAAGVNIVSNTGMPGGSSTIQIRGISSINGSTPLIVIDGIPTGDASAINRINPGDIESIEVLKDAASAAIYGSTGGNGVIIINTKKGQAGKITTSLNFYTGIQNVSRTIPMMNTKQWNGLYAEMNNGVPYTMNADTLAKDYNWQDALFRQAQMTSFDVNISGGSEKSKFSLGLNDLSQDGIVKNTGYEKLLMSISSVHDITKHIKLDEVVRFSNEKTTAMLNGNIKMYITILQYYRLYRWCLFRRRTMPMANGLFLLQVLARITHLPGLTKDRTSTRKI